MSLDEVAEVAVLLIPDWCLKGEQFLSDLDPCVPSRHAELPGGLAADLVDYQPGRAHDLLIIWTGMRMVRAWSAIERPRRLRTCSH